MTNPTAWNAVLAEQIIAGYRDIQGAILPVLHALQDAFGYIPDEAIELVAQGLNISRADVYGILTFYHDFRRSPPGRHVLQLCRAESCQAMGGDALADHVRERLGIDWGETRADGSVTLLPVFCLGLCACSPSALLDGRPMGRLSQERMDALLDEVTS
jgi:formate dehydrogenase subunit gamma